MTLLKTHDSAASADKPRPARGSVSRTSIRRAHACRSHQRRGLRPRATEVPRDGLCLVYSFCMPSRAPAGPDSGARAVYTLRSDSIPRVTRLTCAGMRWGGVAQT